MGAENSLLPADFGFDSPERSPEELLREQAALFAGRTDNLVVAEVESELGEEDPWGADNSGDLLIRFVLRAPVLHNYRYVLFTFAHDLATQFPIRVVHAPLKERPLENEDELKAFLSEVFKSDQTRSVLRNLVNRSRAATASRAAPC